MQLSDFRIFRIFLHFFDHRIITSIDYFCCFDKLCTSKLLPPLHQVVSCVHYRSNASLLDKVIDQDTNQQSFAVIDANSNHC